ncbi:MAG: HAD family phosphatase [Planctomycetota bacterium]
MTPNPLQAVVFDFDGVLVDSEPLHRQALQALGSELGYTVSDAAYDQQLIAFDDRQAMRWIAQHAGLEPAEVAGNLADWIEHKQRWFEDHVRQHGAPPIPGAVELVRALADAGVPRAIGSGATRRDIAALLPALGLDGAFDLVVSADDVARSKPDPETYASAVRQLAQGHPDRAITPAGCVAIEDTAGGSRSAVGAGLAVAGVATTGPADRLLAAGAARVWPDPSHLTVPALAELIASG